MSSGENRRCTRSGINNAKDRKLPVKSQKKKPKCTKTVCDAESNERAGTDHPILNDAGQSSCKSLPYVMLERLNLDVTAPISVSELSLPVTENVKISKSPRKTGNKGKNAIPPVVEKLNDTSSKRKSFKNVKLSSSNETHSSSCNDGLGDLNAASSDLSEILSKKTYNKNFFTDVLKMKCITESSMCECDDPCVPVVLDASLVLDAFKFYQWRKALQNLPSSSNSTNDFPVDILSNSNQLNSETDHLCNREPVPNKFVNIGGNKISQSESHENVAFELDLGFVIECGTECTAANHSECPSVREISDNCAGSDSNPVIKRTVRNRICSQNLQEKVRQKSKASSTAKEADSSITVQDNFQNDSDLDLKICDVQGECSDEVIQYLMEDHDEINSFINEMALNNENENHSFVSNDEQEVFIEHESIEQSLGKEDGFQISGSNQMDSKQPLTCNILRTDSLTVSEEKNEVLSAKNLDAFDRHVQSPDDKEYSESLASEATSGVSENVSVVVDDLSPNNSENTVNDGSGSQPLPCTRPDEQNSSSRGFYEADILADELDYEPSEAMVHYEEDMLVDQLDYEPSEASEIDASETESCNGEVQAKEGHSDSQILSAENRMENSVEAHEILSDGDGSKIPKDPFTEQHAKDALLGRPEETTRKQKEKPDKTGKSCNATESSVDKDSIEFRQKTDTFADQTAHHSPPNNDDRREPFSGCDQTNFSNSFCSKQVDTSQEKSFETSDAEFDEINNSKNLEGNHSNSFQSDEEENSNFYEKPFLKKRAGKSQKRSVDSEDDSESDSEHSFKRKSSNDNQGIGFHDEENPADEFSQSKVDSPLNNLEGVLLSIEKKCKNGKLDDALRIANDYIAISDQAAKRDIFEKLFFDLMDSFRDSNHTVTEDLCLDTMKSTMLIFYDLNLWTTELCSDIICECLNLKLTSSFGKQLFAFCQKNDIHISCEAVNAYIDTLKPTDLSLAEMISFLNFISKCRVPPPNFILKQMLNILFQNEEDILVPELTEICKLLCSVDSSRLYKDDIKKFVKLCLEKRYWAQIAHLICEWAQRGPQITWVIETALKQFENVGFWYEELAKEIYGPRGQVRSDVPLQARFIIGQMGVCLLMKAASKKDYDSAFDVLLVFHRFNINYLDYQAPMCKASWYLKRIPDPTKIFVFPFTVAFTALDICLHLERPKDAFKIFKSFSLDLPKEFEDALKLEIRSRRFHYLLKIALALQPKDPLGTGIEAFRFLLSTAQNDFTLEQLGEYSKDLPVVYNKYMVCILNAQKENLIKEFYPYSHGPMKEFFTLDCQVLRGLIVFFVKCKMLDEANTLFDLGKKNIYEFKKPAVLTPPWRMVVNHDWTCEEIKLTFLRFTETLNPVLRSKKRKDDFDRWFSVKILIREVPEVVYEVDCLSNCDLPLERISTALKAVDSKIQWKQLEKNKHVMHLIPESFYTFWFSQCSKCPISPVPGQVFKVPGNVRVPFGEFRMRERSDCESRTYIHGLGSSESVDNNLVAETYRSDERILDDDRVISDDSAYVTSRNVPTVPQNFLGDNHNNHQMFVQENVSKNTTYFTPKRTISGCSTARQDISPHNGDNYNMVNFDNASPKSNISISSSPRTPISSTPIRAENRISSGGTSTSSPRRPTSSTPPRAENRISSGGTSTSSPRRPTSSTPPRAENRISSGGTSTSSPRRPTSSTPPRAEKHISSGGTSSVSPRKPPSSTPPKSSPKSVSTVQPPQRTFLKSPRKIMSPSAQRKSPQTLSSANNMNTSIGTTDLDLPGANLNKCDNLIPATSAETVEPKIGLKSSKKTLSSKTALIKKHTASCTKIKKVGSNILKAKSKISMLPFDLKSIKITLQNDSSQHETIRVVQPASGARPVIEAPQEDTVDSEEESNFQCNVSSDVFNKIKNFLESKVMVKCKDLTLQQQQRKALRLARAFIESNVVSTLDKKTMKLLSDFSSECI